MTTLWSREEPVEEMQKRTYLLQKAIRRQLAQASNEEEQRRSQLPDVAREELEHERDDAPLHIATEDGGIAAPVPRRSRRSFEVIGGDGRTPDGLAAPSEAHRQQPYCGDEEIRVVDLSPSSHGEESDAGAQPDYRPPSDGDGASPYAGSTPPSPGSILARGASGMGAHASIEFDPKMIALRVRCASLLVRNALQNLDHALMDQILGEDDDIKSEGKMKRYIRAHSAGYRIFMSCVILLHLLLTFVEPFAPDDPSVLPLPISIILSLLFSLVYVFDLSVKYTYMRKKDFFTVWTSLRILLVALNIIESVILLALLLANVNVFLVSRMWRPFYLIERSSSLRLIVESTLHSARNCISIFFIIFCVVFFFSYLGFIIFAETTEGRMYFGTIGDALTNMFVLMTTANFPDVMMPAYSENAAWSLFFISYLVIVLFFLIHLVTATFYNSFTELATDDILAQLEVRRDSLEMAFHLADYDGTGALSFMQWSELYTQLHPRAKDEHVQLTFKMVDKDGSNSINIDEFLQICDFIDLRFYSKKRRQHSNHAGAQRSIRKRLYEFMRNQYTVLFRQIFILANCVFLVLDTAACSPGPDLVQTWDCPSLDYVALAATVVFLVEQALLVYSYGRRFATPCRLIDIVLCVIMFVAQIVAFVINRLTPEQSRLLLLPRIFIILRLFVNFARTRRITKALLRMITPILRYMIVLLCFYYTYAIIGVELFHGYIDPLDPDPRLAGTLFATSNFWANNFNTLASAWVVLYELMIVNNFFVTMEGYVIVTNKWTRIYFIFFICLAVYIFLNLFVGFIIQAFLRSYEGIEFRKTFRQNLQDKVDAAAALCGLDQSDRRWFAEFKPNLLDYYLDVFHLEHTLRPSSAKEDNSTAAEDASAAAAQSVDQPPGDEQRCPEEEVQQP